MCCLTKCMKCLKIVEDHMVFDTANDKLEDNMDIINVIKRLNKEKSIEINFDKYTSFKNESILKNDTTIELNKA